MAHNTKPILVDVNGKPIPQYFDPLADEYKPLLGQYGAARSILYGPDGQPIGTSGNPLQVKAQDTDDVLEQIKDALGPLATETKLEAVRTLVEDLKSELLLVKSELANIKANQISGDQKVQLSGHIQEFAVASWDDLPPDSVPVGSVAMLIGTNDIRQTDGEEWLPI